MDIALIQAHGGSFATVFFAEIGDGAGSFAKKRVEETGEAAVGADDVGNGVERVPFQVNLAVFKGCGFGFDFRCGFSGGCIVGFGCAVCGAIRSGGFF